MHLNLPDTFVIAHYKTCKVIVKLATDCRRIIKPEKCIKQGWVNLCFGKAITAPFKTFLFSSSSKPTVSLSEDIGFSTIISESR